MCSQRSVTLLNTNDDPREMYKEARVLKLRDKLLEAAQTFSYSGKAFASSGNFELASHVFREAIDAYLAVDEFSQANSCYTWAANCSINSGMHLNAMAYKFEDLEVCVKSSNWVQVAHGGYTLAELLDPTIANKSQMNQLLATMSKWDQPPTTPPFLSYQRYVEFCSYFVEMPQLDQSHIAELLSVLFGRTWLVKNNDFLCNLYEKATADVHIIVPRWREVLASALYTRACIAYAAREDFEEVNILLSRLLNLWGVFKEVWGETFFYQHQYNFFGELERASKKNFQQADRFYFKKMQAYAAALRAKSSKLFYLYKGWEIFGGYGVGIIRAALTALLLPLVVFPLLYALSIPVGGKLEGANMQPLYWALNSIYFSIVTFTTLGYGDISPKGFAKIIASLEAITGYLVLALIVTIIARKMFRSL